MTGETIVVVVVVMVEVAVNSSYLFLVVQTLVVILEDGHAFRAAGCVFIGRVDDVAGEYFLPEGEAPAGTCWR